MSEQAPSPLTMTREEVALHLRVSTKTVDRMWRKGEIPKPFRIGSAVRFLRHEIMAIANSPRAVS